MTFFSRVPFKRRGRELAAAAGIVLAAAALLLVLVGNMISDNQKTMIQMQSGQLRSISESVARQIEVFAEEMASDLEMEAGLDQFARAESFLEQGEQAPMEQLLSEFLEGRRGSVKGMAWESAGYRLERWTEGQEPLALRTASFMTEESADLAVSILQDERDWCYLKLSKLTQSGNRLSCLLSFNDVYEKTAADIKMGQNGYVMVKSSDGLILMHQVEEQIGQNVLAGRMEMYPELDFTELTQLIEHQNQGRGGVEIYHSYWWIEDPPRPVKKVSAYDPAWIGDDFLIVSAVIDYADITLPMQKAIVRIVAAAVFLVLFLGLFLLLIGKMFLHQKKVDKENVRLKEVNERLEELRKREEAMAHQQRLQLIGTMTGGIAHEFNNLLTPIMGYSAMMLSEMDPQNPYYGDVEEILNSAEKAKEIIGQISSFSGKNAKKSFQELLISQTAAKAMLVAESGKPEKVELSMNLVFEPYWIWGNETQIHQIVLNLCTNAFHAMRESGGRLTVSGAVRQGKDMAKNRFFSDKQEQEFYELTFSDTGCGMSEEVKSQIFDPFYTTRKSGEGTGLGLYLVHRMVEEHRGTITVESELGRGTVFRIYFPVFCRDGKEEKSGVQNHVQTL